MKYQLSNEETNVDIDKGCTKEFPFRTKLEEHKPSYDFCFKNKECSINNSLDCSINDIKRIPQFKNNSIISQGCTIEYQISSNESKKCYKDAKCLENENECDSDFIYKRTNNVSFGCTPEYPHRSELDVHKPSLNICFNNKECSTKWNNSCWQNIKFLNNDSERKC